MTDNANFTRIMDGLNEVLRHVEGEEVPGMVIHRPGDRAANHLRDLGFGVQWDVGMLLYRVSGLPNLTKLTEMQLVQIARQYGWAG